MINAKAISVDDLEGVTGGVKVASKGAQYMRIECPHCHDIFQGDVSKSTINCPTCHKPITIKG